MTRFALVHDWFDCIAGSEKVVREIKHCFPTSDVFSLVDHLSNAERQELGIDEIRASFIQGLPFARKRFRHYLPLMPAAIEQFDLSAYDVILSSSHAVAKGVVTNAEQLHISYVHTPIRYAWDMYHEYLQRGLTRGPKAAFVKAVLHYIRMWDRSTADRPDIYVANSHYVAARIRKIYGREAKVIYPPVNVHRWNTHHKKENFFFAAGRLVPYKRFDLLLDAFAKLPDQRLVIIGDGPEYKKLKARATSNVEMLGYQEDEVLFDHMKRARAFVLGQWKTLASCPSKLRLAGRQSLVCDEAVWRKPSSTAKPGCFLTSRRRSAWPRQFACSANCRPDSWTRIIFVKTRNALAWNAFAVNSSAREIGHPESNCFDSIGRSDRHFGRSLNPSISGSLIHG